MKETAILCPPSNRTGYRKNAFPQRSLGYLQPNGRDFEQNSLQKSRLEMKNFPYTLARPLLDIFPEPLIVIVYVLLHRTNVIAGVYCDADPTEVRCLNNNVMSKQSTSAPEPYTHAVRHAFYECN